MREVSLRRTCGRAAALRAEWLAAKYVEARTGLIPNEARVLRSLSHRARAPTCARELTETNSSKQRITVQGIPLPSRSQPALCREVGTSPPNPDQLFGIYVAVGE